MTTQVIRIFNLVLVLIYHLPAIGKTIAPEVLIQIEKAVVKKSACTERAAQT
jgi:hypothetical protein